MKPIMKTLKTLLLTKSLFAAAIAAGSLAAPTAGHALTFAGSPDDGMVCRADYTGALNGTRFKCTKTRDITVVLECTNPLFPIYVIRAVNGAASDGKDLCTKAGVVITSNGSLAGLVEARPGRNGDYTFAAVVPATVTTRVTAQDQAEATAQGLTVSEVDTVAAQPVVQIDGSVGSKDNARVTLTFFTFAIPGSGGLTLPGPLVPALPRALP